MRVTDETRIEFRGEPGFGGSGASLEVAYDNMGDPYRQGASFYFRDGEKTVHVFLHGGELWKLRECLNKLNDAMKPSGGASR